MAFRSQPVRRRRMSPAPAPKKRSSPRRRMFLKQILIGIFLLFLLFLVGTGVWYGTRLEALTITTVKVEGGETISHDTVREIAERELQGDYYNFVPRRFVWSYPKEVILSKVDSLPRVKGVTIERVKRDTVLISVEEYYPLALWCGSPGSADESNCFFLDAEGYAFIEAPTLRGSSMLRYFDVSLEPAQGERPFDAAFMNASSRFAFLIAKELQFNTSHIERTGPEEALYYLAGGSQLKVSFHQSVEDTFDNLLAILGSEEFDHLEPGNFQYVDLRFGNKVFVNEDMSKAIEETATSTPEL